MLHTGSTVHGTTHGPTYRYQHMSPLFHTCFSICGVWGVERERQRVRTHTALTTARDGMVAALVTPGLGLGSAH